MGRPKKYKTEEEAKVAEVARLKKHYEKQRETESEALKTGDISARTARLEKISASQRRRRAEGSMESNSKRRQLNAERMQKQRENESQESRAIRLSHDAAAQKRFRESQSDDARAVRHSQDAEAHRRLREQEPEEARALRRSQDAEAHRRLREQEPEEARALRRSQNAEAHRRLREHESEDARDLRHFQDAEAHRRLREQESEEARALRHSQNAEAHRRLREQEPEEARALRHFQDQVAHRHTRENEAEEVHALRKSQDAKAHRRLRQNEENESRALRLSQDATAHTSRRVNETEVQRSQRREYNRQIYVNRVQNLRIRLRGDKLIMTEDENTIAEHSCGQMNVMCSNCGSKNFQPELPSDGLFSQCCQKGKVKLPATKYPELLEKLLKKEHVHSKNFIENIRSINSSFGFASMGANISPPPGYGPYCFRIHGVIHHRTGTLHPIEGDEPKFAQLYIFDTAEATDKRLQLNQNQNINPNLMQEIANLLETVNPFVTAYKMLYEVEKEEEQRAKANNTLMPKIVMAIKQDRQQDQRRYNLPRVNEVAVVFQNEDGEPPFERDLLIHLRQENPLAQKTERINILNANIDALIYPIFFPYGEQGWHENLKQHGSSNRVTHLQYYSYLLSVRNGFNPILSGGKLSQQFWVDAYVKIEGNRLNFIKFKQEKLKVEDYCYLQEHLLNKALEKGIPIGRTVILPSSFQGSPRNMQQRYQDAMSIVTKFGRPDLFVTMTCNPNWNEIKENLEPWQSVEHRPDLVARVFRIKLKSLLKDINNGFFGIPIAVVYVIEFQKRGLPHAHILIILENESKLKTEEEIDKIVWAEIPDDEKYPVLHQLVTSHMIHGPCGKNSKSPCMENDQCSKGFPKAFNECTIKEQDGYPRYKRRLGKSYLRKGKNIDNSWVVSYNPYFIKKYNCHINVEVCASIKSVKYLFKYVYKGHDQANIVIQQSVLNHDETIQFVDSRYVSAPEAAWRIFAFPMHHQSHTIVRLAVHLPNTHSLFFYEDDKEQDLQEKMNRNSTLMAYFNLNVINEDAKQLYYREIPEHFIFEKGIWKQRKRGGSKVIGRMYTVSVKEGERYYLRLILLHVKAATSFDDLKTVNGIEYPTFKETAVALGLLLDDDVWRNTIIDAIVLKMPSQLRDLFAYICVFGPPTDPLNLWTEFKTDFCEDICYRRHTKGSLCLNCESFAMKEVQDVLVLHGKSYADFALPVPSAQPLDMIQEYNPQQELNIATEMKTSLNPDQKIAYDLICKSINSSNNDLPKCFFIDGPGGTGKTYLYKTLMHQLRGEGYVVLPAATTGIAANLLEGGRTMHSFYGVPVPINETSVSKITAGSIAGNLLKNAKLLIIDECTMAPKYALALIDRLLRDVTTENVNNKITTPFGGKVIVLGGDFRQCLPVVPNGHRTDIVEICLKQSSLWNLFTKLELRNNMRSTDPTFSSWLLQLGNGELNNDANLGDDVIEIPPDMLSSECLITDIFGNSIVIDPDDPLSIKRAASHAILCPKNEDVDILNFQVMDRMSGDYVVYLSDDAVEVDDENERENYPLEFLNSLTPSGMPAHRLRIKRGTIVMLLRNLNSRKGLCNGTRLIVTDMQPNVVHGKVISGSDEGKSVFIPRIDLCPTETGLPFKLRRRQFPIKPAFAITINKSQGQTLQRVGIYLPQPVFGHGQLYVAFSRVKSSAHVKVKVVDTPLQGKLIEGSNRVFTKNVVYKNVL